MIYYHMVMKNKQFHFHEVNLIPANIDIKLNVPHPPLSDHTCMINTNGFINHFLM